MTSDVEFLSGGVAVDDRGSLLFCNDADFAKLGVRRFYMVSNHEAQFVRAWHGHKKEAKYIFVLSGAAVVGAVRIDDWVNPSPTLEVRRYVLAEERPGLLKIPGGFAHGTMTLRPGTRLIFFSTATLSESAADDFRFEAFTWNPWTVVPR
jgi:dTDP-4-dehydrorhamnose 3,5-epimerase-like enzyme